MSWRDRMGLIGCELSRHISIGFTTYADWLYDAGYCENFCITTRIRILEYLNLNSIKLRAS